MNTTFWCFNFIENKYSSIFVKKKKKNQIKYLGPTITDLSHQRTHTHTLSLSLFVGGCHKIKIKKWRERQSRKLCQTKKIDRNKKWVQEIKIENEYNLNTNQTSPRTLGLLELKVNNLVHVKKLKHLLSV